MMPLFRCPYHTLLEDYQVDDLDCGGYRVYTDLYHGFYNADRKLHREGEPAFVYYRTGEQLWLKNGVVDRDDGPAFIRDNRRVWYKNGLKHRIGGPAVIDDKEEYWMQNGMLHREDGPAVIRPDHNIYEWYWYGKLHRNGGPAKYGNIGESWYRKGHLHRTDGPAWVSRSGSKEWRYRGGLHRTDGPAYISSSGAIGCWAYYGKRFNTLEAFLEHATIDEKLKVELVLLYGGI